MITRATTIALARCWTVTRLLRRVLGLAALLFVAGVVHTTFHPAHAQQEPSLQNQNSNASFEGGDAQRVGELLQGLDAGTLARRQQAEKDLLDMGTAILALLPAPNSREEGLMSAEALQRLRRVRRTLEQARAVAGAEATLVRLGAVTSLQEAVEQLRKVGNANFRLMDSLDRPLQLELGPMPFWNAVDEVLDAAALDVNYYVGQTGEIGLVQRDAQRGPRTQGTAYAGVFRLEATSVSARRNFRMPAQNGLSVGLEIAWEPRLTPVGLTLPLEEVVAECEDGQLLRPEKGQLEVSTNSSLPFSELSIQFPLPIETPRRLKTLRGVIRSLLPGANDHFRVPLAMPHEPESAGDLTFWVESVRANGTLHEVRVEVVLAEAAYAFESHRQWVFDNPAYVMGDDGQRLEHLGYQTYRQSASGVGIAYLFDFSGKLEGKTFHYQSPVSMVEKTHTFELTDIDLP